MAAAGKNKKFRRPTSDDIPVEAIYNPAAISLYYESSKGVGSKPSSGDAKALIDSAKSHLSAIGWSFFRVTKSTGTMELRYRSPTGRAYISLRTACKACLDDPQQSNPPPGHGSGTSSVDFDDGVVQQSQLRPPPVSPTKFTVGNCNGFVQQSQLPLGYPCDNVVGNCYGVVQETPIPKNHTIVNSYDGNLIGFDDFLMSLDSTSFDPAFGNSFHLLKEVENPADHGHDSSNYLTKCDGLVLKENQLLVNNPNLDNVTDFNYDAVFFDPLPQEINGWFGPEKLPQEIIGSVPTKLPQEIVGAIPEKLPKSRPKRQGKRGREKEIKVSPNFPRKRAKAVVRHIGVGDRHLGSGVGQKLGVMDAFSKAASVIWQYHSLMYDMVTSLWLWSTMPKPMLPWGGGQLS